MSSPSCPSITERVKVVLDPDSDSVDLAVELVDLRGGGGMVGDRQLWEGVTGGSGLGFESG